MELWVEIVICVVAVLGIVSGSIFATKWAQAVKLLRELGEAFTVTANALEDKKLTKQEAIDCLAKWQQVFIQIMLMLGKLDKLNYWHTK